MTRKAKRQRTFIPRLLSGVIAGYRQTRGCHWIQDELPSS